MANLSFDVKRACEELGDPSTWKSPQGYRRSLALCVMDSIWSLGIRYQTVEKVLDRYLVSRGWTGLDAAQSCVEGPTALLEWY